MHTQAPGGDEQNDSWGLAFIMMTLVASIGVMYLLHWTKFRYIPESIGVILVGTVASQTAVQSATLVVA